MIVYLKANFIRFCFRHDKKPPTEPKVHTWPGSMNVENYLHRGRSFFHVFFFRSQDWVLKRSKSGRMRGFVARLVLYCTSTVHSSLSHLTWLTYSLHSPKDTCNTTTQHLTHLQTTRFLKNPTLVHFALLSPLYVALFTSPDVNS